MIFASNFVVKWLPSGKKYSTHRARVRDWDGIKVTKGVFSLLLASVSLARIRMHIHVHYLY